MPENTTPDFIVICEEGKPPLGADKLSAAGFSIGASPAMFAASGVRGGKMTCLPCLYNYIRRPVETTPFEDNLRSAYAKMLHDYADAPYNAVYGEDDACPSAGVTREWLDGFLASPAVGLYDVIVLGLDKTCPPCSSLPPQDGSCIVEVNQLYNMIWSRSYPSVYGRHNLLYGTQAVWVRPESRPVLEGLFRQVVAPTDTLLLHAGMTGALRVGKCTSNLFYQKFHSRSHR